MAKKGKHSKENIMFTVFRRSFLLTLCAVSLIVIGYFTAMYLFGSIQ